MKNRIRRIFEEKDACDTWVEKISGVSLEAVVVGAVAAINEYFDITRKKGAERVPAEDAARDIIKLVELWIEFQDEESTKLAFEGVSKVEALAEKADALSEEPGDWWTYEAVETVGFLLVSIAQESNFMGYSEDYPDPPIELAAHVCKYFQSFGFDQSTNRDRVCSAAKRALYLHYSC